MQIFYRDIGSLCRYRLLTRTTATVCSLKAKNSLVVNSDIQHSRLHFAFGRKTSLQQATTSDDFGRVKHLTKVSGFSSNRCDQQYRALERGYTCSTLDKDKGCKFINVAPRQRKLKLHHNNWKIEGISASVKGQLLQLYTLCHRHRLWGPFGHMPPLVEKRLWFHKSLTPFSHNILVSPQLLRQWPLHIYTTGMTQ